MLIPRISNNQPRAQIPGMELPRANRPSALASSFQSMRQPSPVAVCCLDSFKRCINFILNPIYALWNRFLAYRQTFALPRRVQQNPPQPPLVIPQPPVVQQARQVLPQPSPLQLQLNDYRGYVRILWAQERSDNSLAHARGLERELDEIRRRIDPLDPQQEPLIEQWSILQRLIQRYLNQIEQREEQVIGPHAVIARVEHLIGNIENSLRNLANNYHHLPRGTRMHFAFLIHDLEELTPEAKIRYQIGIINNRAHPEIIQELRLRQYRMTALYFMLRPHANRNDYPEHIRHGMDEFNNLARNYSILTEEEKVQVLENIHGSDEDRPTLLRAAVVWENCRTFIERINPEQNFLLEGCFLWAVNCYQNLVLMPYLNENCAGYRQLTIEDRDAIFEHIEDAAPLADARLEAIRLEVQRILPNVV